ncbi:hypothetical protein QAD02_011115, partial [Eretmocerus hayati]
PPRENVPVHAVFTNPEYIKALARELEKEGAAAIDHENDIQYLRNSLNRMGIDLDSKKMQSHRPLKSTEWGLSERVLFPSDLLSIVGDSPPKRNIDEIDRTDFSSFEGKRSIDEIDHSGFSGFTRKRNIDEIDPSGFSGFSRKRNIDEIDRSSGFSDFGKRSIDDDLYRFGGRRSRSQNFDEIDRSGFAGFRKLTGNFDELEAKNKRNFDEIDRSGLPTFTKRSESRSRR